MAFDFKVKFNQNGELVELEHEPTASNPKGKASFPKDFREVSDPLAAVAKPGEITIDLKLLRLEGDDPCITHNGRRYCW